ncbi:hypothetical protein FKM82_014645 [Ascaphus truei]
MTSLSLLSNLRSGRYIMFCVREITANYYWVCRFSTGRQMAAKAQQKAHLPRIVGKDNNTKQPNKSLTTQHRYL